MPSLTQSPAWKSLRDYHASIKHRTLAEWFAKEPDRGTKLTADAGGWFLDYSKNRIGTNEMGLLFALARDRAVPEKIEAMFTGKKFNNTEERAVLHTALRATRDATVAVEGTTENVVPGVHRVLDKMEDFAERVRSGAWRGYTGRRIKNVVNIGIGGSDLGPVMAFEALRHYTDRSLTFRFVSNVDGADFVEATRDLEPTETLFIVSSKTFTTTETMANAETAKAWLLGGLGGKQEAVANHFVSVSTAKTLVESFGINSVNMFEFWDWVGGRYSMSSAIGLSTMIAIGPHHFRALLEGFRTMDEHFRTTPLEKNLPVILGLLTVWYTNFFKAETVAVLPYENYLKRFPAYLQQLTMESNGKQRTRDGVRVNYDTCPIFWGEPGTNGQHSFYQLIHQGTRLIPCDFIAFARALTPLGRHHDLLIANVFAQARALAFGKSLEEAQVEAQQEGKKSWLAEHRVFEGNRPSNVLLAERLTPSVLGQLVALYEHSVFVQGAIWDINPFDQWGVQLGKKLAEDIVPKLESDQSPELKYDSSTNNLVCRYRRLKHTA